MRFLKPNEFKNTKNLAIECFGESSDLDEYYSKDIFENRIAVFEENEKIISMAHLKRMLLEFEDETVSAWYILYVATSISHQKQGYMKQTLSFVLDTLKKEGEGLAFLVPVNEEIYKSLGFTFKWEFNEAEADILYADDGLKHCFACWLGKKLTKAPIKIKCADGIQDIKYIKFDDSACVDFFDYFYIRHNKSYNSVPLDSYIWNKAVDTECGIIDDRCFIMRDKSGDTVAGCIPFCKEEELVYYFKLQERYFNEVLHLPFSAYLADNEGVELLRKSGALDNYIISRDEEIFDYIYDAEALRSLKGRKYSDKRNRINKFTREFIGRWNYKTLGAQNTNEILEFLEKWYAEKSVNGKGVNLGDDYDATETLKIEHDGLVRILQNTKLLNMIKMGGIYIDGKLSAFSLGSYNPKEEMAVIEIEKAFYGFEGLYQLINREFLVHEFSFAKLVNREDDDGLPGLRKSKMTYNPIEFEKRFMLLQKDFSAEK